MSTRFGDHDGSLLRQQLHAPIIMSLKCAAALTDAAPAAPFS